MSLVEQAARKLEQLRKAGEQVAGDLAYPTSGNPDEAAPGKDNTIERLAAELEKRQRPSPQQPATPTPDPLKRAASPAVDVNAVEADSKRREPVLRPTSSPQSPARPGLAPHPGDAGTSRSKVAEIDLTRLAGRGLLTPDATQSRLANEMRVIKRPLINNCLSRSAVKNGNRIMITSSVPGEGKSYIATNLALTIATERDSTVLLVEADPTRPSLSELFGIPAGRGLMDLLTEPRLEGADVLVRTSIGRLSFIPAGTPQEHATELLASGAMERLVDQLASRYPDRIVIFDSAPLLAAPEARVLARHMGQIVMVVAAETTTHSVAQQALASIESCPIVMTVLNKASAHQETAYYYAG
jgi:receptor protein-tyrosine kinase